MRVLFVISTLRSGGAERVCSMIASKFSELNDVSLVKFDDKPPFYELNSSVKILNLTYGVAERGLIGNLKKRLGKIFALRKIIKSGEFDAVISFLDSTNILAIISSFGFKTPVIISEHTSFDAPKKAIFKLLKRIFYPYANALSVLTKSDKKHYDKFCKNVQVIYNPNFSQNDDKIEFLKENLVIFVGRLTAVKNCEMFIKVAANLRQFGYKFIVAGDGELRLELQNLAQKLNANVEFLGEVANISKLYGRAKVLLSTSNYEGLGNTMIEAINFNCARVATKTSGAMELINHEFDGFLCDNDDKMASEIVLNLMQDESKRTLVCNNAKARIKEFCLENIYEKWLELLKKGGVN